MSNREDTLTDVKPGPTLPILVTSRPLPYLLLPVGVVLEPDGLDVSSVNADEECRRVCIPRSRNVADGGKGRTTRHQKNRKREREREGEGCRNWVKRIAASFADAYA